jgi:hypothetical protein
MKKKPFVLGKDVARALDEIVSINDGLSPEYLAAAQARREEAESNASRD